MIKPTAQELDLINMRPVSDLVLTQSGDKKYIGMPAGKEHYRLLYWLGSRFDRIMELGTYRGHSAVAMAVGGAEMAFVCSYDIENHRDTISIPENLTFQLSESGHEGVEDLRPSLIFLDTFHDGTYERVVLNHLREIKWKGVLVMDDIFLNREMREVWSEITERKEDWTDIGHWSGTGIVYFE